MQFPEWTKPALLGVGVGAIAVSIIGFSWGGWTTSGAAMEMADKQSAVAVAMALTPYCVELSQNDPNSTEILAKLADTSVYSRRGVVEDAGWATPLGADGPNRALADNCQKAVLAE